MTQTSVEEQVSTFQENLQQVREELGRAIIGLDDVINQLLTAVIAGGHVLFEGVPGVGKTLLARSLGRVLGLTNQRIQFTPDLMPADILGSHILVEDGAPRMEFIKGPIFTQVLLADEINRCTPKTQAALLEAMQERAVTISGSRHELDELFFTIATQNPIEMEGTYPLPEAQLDRFFFKIIVPPPDINNLRQIGRLTTGNDMPEAAETLTKENVLALQNLVREVPVPETAEEYAARLILSTSPQEASAPSQVKEYVRYGASPRGMQALMLGSKVKALMDGRFSVSSQDVRAVCLPSLRHRIILNFEAEAEGIITDDILEALFISVPVPGQS